MTNENEIWKDIVGYEGLYEVSNTGNVRSLKFGKIKILKLIIKSTGYYNVSLCKNGKSKTFNIHYLVASAFLGKSNGLQVNHKDSDRQNNTLENIEYVSSRDNVVHGRLSMQKENKSSKYVGVYFFKRDKKYIASIRINGKLKYLGLFETEIEASEAYQKALSEIEPNTKYAKNN